MMQNPYRAYQQQSVMTMTQGELLLALYDGIIKEISFAQCAFEQKNLAEINKRLQKVQTMITYLKTTLDYQHPISQDLCSLYDYFIGVVLQANLKKDDSGLPGIKQMISELRDVYAQADKITRGSGSGRERA